MRAREIYTEASYKGNIGIMEMVHFMRVASEKQKQKLDQLIKQKKNREAWKLIQEVTGKELQGDEFN